MVYRNKTKDITGSNQFNPRFRTFFRKEAISPQTSFSINQSLKPHDKKKGGKE